MNQYFPESYVRSDRNVKIQIDLSQYSTKAELKVAKGIIYTSMLASKTDLASLKTKVDHLDVDELKIVQLI